MKYLFLSLVFIFITSSFLPSEQQEYTKPVSVVWVDSLDGDFSFIDKWDYPHNVFKNVFGQLICDGFCPESLDSLRNSEDGRIPDDKLDEYYQLLDTTHLYHTLEYIDDGGNRLSYIYAEKRGDTIFCVADDALAGYSSLNIQLSEDGCVPSVHYISPEYGVDYKIYNCSEGIIRIDKKFWERGILKADFNFYISDEDNIVSVLWAGRIYTYIADSSSLE